MDKNKTIQYAIVGIALIVALVGSYFGVRLPAPVIPEPTSGDIPIDIPVDMPIGAYTVAGSGEGYTNFTNVAIEADLSVGDEIAVTGNATFAGTLDLTGALTAEDLTLTDDLVVGDDFTLSGDVIVGTQIIDLNEFGTSTITTDTTTNLMEIYDATNIMTGGTNSLSALNIDLGIGNSTGGTNNVYGILIDGITQDASNTETAISVGSGWDTALSLAGASSLQGAVTLGADGTSFDFTFYSDTGGDYMLWDQDAEALTIIGTNGQDALNVDDGNVDIADDIDVDGTANLDNTDIDGTLDVDGNISSTTGAVTVTDSMNVSGDLTLQALLLSSFADETITDGETLTATKTVYALDSAGNVTMTLAASASEGQILILIGDDNNTVTIADTNIRTSDGNAIALGQYDVVVFVYQDAEWIEISLSANS